MSRPTASRAKNPLGAVHPLLRYYTVFNAEQCENIAAARARRSQLRTIPECERIVRSMPNAPRVEHAALRPSTGEYRHHHDAVAAALRVARALLLDPFPRADAQHRPRIRLARKGITDSSMFGSHSTAAKSSSPRWVRHSSVAPRESRQRPCRTRPPISRVGSKSSRRLASRRDRSGAGSESR